MCDPGKHRQIANFRGDRRDAIEQFVSDALHGGPQPKKVEAYGLVGVERHPIRNERIHYRLKVRIPTQSGHRFRFEAGHRSDLMSATIPK
jgi:hypothetical protein